MTDWKTQNDESKPLPSNGDMFGHDNNSAHLGYAIGFSYKKTGVVMFSGFKWVKFKYTFLYNGTNTKAPLDLLHSRILIRISMLPSQMGQNVSLKLPILVVVMEIHGVSRMDGHINP